MNETQKIAQFLNSRRKTRSLPSRAHKNPVKLGKRFRNDLYGDRNGLVKSQSRADGTQVERNGGVFCPSMKLGNGTEKRNGPFSLCFFCFIIMESSCLVASIWWTRWCRYGRSRAVWEPPARPPSTPCYASSGRRPPFEKSSDAAASNNDGSNRLGKKKKKPGETLFHRFAPVLRSGRECLC